MGKRRKWITISKAPHGLYYWDCPQTSCSVLAWGKEFPSDRTCVCEFTYQALRIEDNRLLIEVKK